METMLQRMKLHAQIIDTQHIHTGCIVGMLDPIYFATYTQRLNVETGRSSMISPNTRQSEWLDVETDGFDIYLVAVSEEANNATIVHDGDVKGLGLLDLVTLSKRTVGA